MNLIEQLLKQFAEKSGQNKPLLPGQPAGSTPPFVPPVRRPVPPMQNAGTPTPPPQQAPASNDWAGGFAGETRLQEVNPNVTGKHLQDIKPQGVMHLRDIETPDQGAPKAMEKTPFYKDNDRMGMMFSALSDGFGGMTMSGKSGMAEMNKANYAKGMEGVKNNKTMNYLVQHNPELAQKLLQIAPEHRGQFMEAAIKQDFGLDRQFRTQVSALQTDEKTGRKYYLESDGNGNQKIIYAKDDQGNPLYGDTGKSKQDREIELAGVAQARAAGTKFFDKSESLKTSLDTFKQARLALDNGARSGIIDSALPALDANTQNLRSLANTAGIEVINSATFGALSEKELALAMSTGIPTNLPEDQLDAYLDAKIRAQEKLYGEISKKAQQLNTGDRTLGGWQEYWANEERPETYNDEYARRFGTDDMNASYKGWSSGGDETKDDDDGWGISRAGRR